MSTWTRPGVITSWVAGPLEVGGRDLDLINPATGAVTGRLRCADDAVVDLAVRTAAAAQPAWETVPPRDRAAVLHRLADLVEADAARLAAMDSAESGRPVMELLTGDLPSVVEALHWFASCADKVEARVTAQGLDHLGYEVVRPVGVGAAVLPWNFPLAMAAWKVGPALATGNALVLKPSESTPSSVLALADLARRAGVPDGVLAVVVGDGVTGRSLVGHPGIGAVSFTGSVPTGRAVLAHAAGTNLARVSLELGGKAAHLVLPDALGLGDRLFDGLTEAAFVAAGQNCTAATRILVHADIAAEVTAGLVARAESLVLGHPADPGTTLGPLVRRAARDRVDGLVRRAVAAGARVLTGGTIPDRPGWFYPPTVLTDVDAASEIEQTEVFGPVVTVSSYTSPEQALARANSTPFGLAAAVWTQDLQHAHRLARQLRAGLVSVNCYSEGDIATPFGGLGISGFGAKEKGHAAMEQWVTRTGVWLDLP